MSISTDEKSCLCLIVKIVNLRSAFFIFPSFPGWAPKFHNQNSHVFRVLGIQKLRIVKKGTRHIYRSFTNLYLAYNIGLHHDMLLFKQITRAILLSVFRSCLNLLLSSTCCAVCYWCAEWTYVHFVSYERLSACKSDCSTPWHTGLLNQIIKIV